MNSLTPSKVQRPSHLVEVVGRPRIDNLFRTSLFHKVTIIRAPAGYGKTTALSHWLQQMQGQNAWLSIDAADNDPIRYWTHLLHAVAKACENEWDQMLGPILQLQDSATTEFFIDSFLRELSFLNSDLHIAIDDYHLINHPAIHQMMNQLIEQLPEHVHLYVTTRTSLPWPIAKWRVKQWVREVTTDHLRFTFQEAKQFFELKNGTALTQNTLQFLLEKTEGWVAGFVLAALTSQPEVIQQWDVKTQPFISEFLLQEIFATLPPSTQQFLIQTSLLNVLEPSICNLLTNREDSYALLQELEEHGLFIVRIQTDPPAFRYHHLFADALQKELKRRYADEVNTIVQETAQLIKSNGDYLFAIELVLQYQLTDLAASWMTEHLVQLFSSRQTSTFMRWLHQLKSYDHVVPPEMLVMGLITSLSETKLHQAYDFIQELDQRQETERWMEQEEHAAIAYIYETVKAYAILAVGGDLGAVGEMIRKQLAKGPVPSRWDNVQMPYNTFEYTLLRTGLGSKGRLPLIEEGAVIADLIRKTTFKTANVTAFSYGISAESLFERNLLEAAEQELEIALQLGHQHNDPGLFVPMYILKAKMYCHQQQLITAQALLTQVMDTVSEKHWQTSLRIMKAYSYIVMEDSVHAEEELRATESKQPFWQLVYARFLLLEQQVADALSVVIQVKTKAKQDDQLTTILESLVLEAICHRHLGNEQIALGVLHEALQLGAPYYYVRTFLNEASLLPLLRKYFTQGSFLAKWETPPTTYFAYLKNYLQETNNITDRLTSREQEIYNLLTEGLKNREISQRLNLSEGTVRVYLSTIYSKLGVESRTQAILLKISDEGT